MKPETKKPIMLASRGSRLLNYFLDLAAIRLIFNFVLLIFAINHIYFNLLGQVIVNFFVLFLYFLILEGLFSRTAGKLFTKTQVINLKGNKPTSKQILIRSLTRMIPLEQLSFVFFDTGWHDKLSETRVAEV